MTPQRGAFHMTATTVCLCLLLSFILWGRHMVLRHENCREVRIVNFMEKGVIGEQMWRSSKEGLHYSIVYGCDESLGIAALMEMFPGGIANELNFVLFSTSGVHGTYQTIEDEESASESTPDDDEFDDKPVRVGITFLVVHPRVVALRYGNCRPHTPEDFDFLKRLRASSWEQVLKIGAPDA